MARTKGELIDILEKELESFFDTTGVCVTEIDISWVKNLNMHYKRDIIAHITNFDIRAE